MTGQTAVTSIGVVIVAVFTILIAILTLDLACVITAFVGLGIGYGVGYIRAVLDDQVEILELHRKLGTYDEDENDDGVTEDE